MSNLIRPLIDWISALAAFWILVHEGERLATAISAEGVGPEKGSILIIVLAAFLTIRLLSAALGKTVEAVTRSRQEKLPTSTVPSHS